MSLSSEAHFASNPVGLDISRSKFKRESKHLTSFNAGELIPIFVDEYLPGDTFSLDMGSLVRMSTPIFPVMDNAYMDLYFFSVPNRLIWEHWREFMGENRTTHWEQPVEYTVPQIESPATTGWAKGTIADYMGIPTGIPGLSVSALPFRAMGLVWNEWFRDENLKDPCEVPLDETTHHGNNSHDYILGVCRGGFPPKVAKYSDQFTRALPAPQKGPSVLIPMSEKAPVVTETEEFDVTGNPAMKFSLTTSGAHPSGSYPIGVKGNTGNTVAINGAPFTENSINVAPSNLWAHLSQGTRATIAQLREAFQVQKYYEKLARSGSRYTELIYGMFGVTSPDARQQRPEYLGGGRVPINMAQVVQTSASDSTSPQGNTAAVSVTHDRRNVFSASFTEHGYILGFACVRTEHSYQQGIERMWSRKSKFDYYWPVFANISEQFIKNKEIFAQGNSQDDEAFGYQEAWYEYRYKPNRVSSAMRSNYATTLDSWHYADYYTQRPTLSSDWIDETKANIDRTLAVQSEVEDQLIADFYFDLTCVRPMPVYSVPGLIDHH